jgi:CxxC motif-containing protein (DUF1111 family)
MTAVPFDTLKFARKLENAGFAPDQAARTSEALAEAMEGAELATKSDLRTESFSIKSEMREMELRLTIKMGAMIFTLGGVLVAIKFLSR